jgi:hypothetical protein
MQVGSPTLSSIACDVDPLCITKDHSNNVDVECSRSMEGNCIPSQYSKPYLMYSTTNAASGSIDFAKDNVDDGVVNNLPSCSAGRTTVYSPSPLQGGQLTPIRQRSGSPTHQNVRTPQRQVYYKALLQDMEEAKEKDPVHYSIKVPIDPTTVSRAS